MTATIRVGFVGSEADPERALLDKLAGTSIETFASVSAATTAARRGGLDVVVTTQAIDPTTMIELKGLAALVVVGSSATDADTVTVPREGLRAPVLGLAIRAARDVWRERASPLGVISSDDIFESLPIGVAVSGLDDTILEVNAELGALAGVDPAQARGGATTSLVPSRGSTILKLVKKAEAGERPLIKKTKRFVNKDGTTTEAEQSATLLYDESGKPVACVRTLVDVTSRKAAERRLLVDVEELKRAEQDARAARDALASVLGQMPAGVLVVEAPSGKTLLANDELRAIFGQEPGSAQELATRAPISNEDGTPSSGHPLLSVMDSARADESSEFWIERAGKRVPLAGRATRITFGETRAAVFVVQDVSARRAQEAKERALEKDVANLKKLEAIGLLAGGVAHDFNNLLTGVMSFQELASDELKSQSASLERVRDYLAIAQRSSSKAHELAKKLLGFGRNADSPLEPLDLSAVIDGSAELLRSTIGENVTLSLRLSPEAISIKGIKPELEQLLLELAKNASEAMPRGGTLDISTRREVGQAPSGIGALEGELIALVIRDTGAGMSDDVRSHLFEPFFTTKPRGRGTGLGLATVHGIVRRHGGRILVDSAPRRGTKITILLPAAAPLAPAPPVVRAGAPRGGSESILVVDDDPIVLDSASAMLEVLGYRVTRATSADEAIARFSPAIDAVLSDVVMPGKNGLELAQEILTRRPGTPFVLMTGYAGEAFTRGARASVDESLLRMLPVLVKPITIEPLAARLREAIDAKKGTES